MDLSVRNDPRTTVDPRTLALASMLPAVFRLDPYLRRLRTLSRLWQKRSRRPFGPATRREKFTRTSTSIARAAVAPSLVVARMVTDANSNVLQLDERIQHWVPGHKLWTLAKIAYATGVRHQGSGMGASRGRMAVAD